MRIILHPSRCPNSVLRTCALAFCRCRAASPCAFSLSGGSRRLESRFFVCAGGAPGPVRCDDPALPSPSFSAAPSCRSVLPLRPAAPSCRSVLPPCSAALFCRLVLRPVLPLCPAVHLTAPSCRSVLLPCSAVQSFRLVLPSILLPLPAALSCRLVLRSVLLSILLPRSAASFCRPTVRVRQDSPGRRMPFPPSSLGPGKIRLR